MDCGSDSEEIVTIRYTPANLLQLLRGTLKSYPRIIVTFIQDCYSYYGVVFVLVQGDCFSDFENMHCGEIATVGGVYAFWLMLTC